MADRPAEGDDRERLEREFLSEAGEILDRLLADLRGLERSVAGGSADARTLPRVLRDVHSLKGLAGSLGFAAVAAIAHSLEDILAGLRQGWLSLTASSLALLSEGIDLLAFAVQGAGEGRTAAPTESWHDRVRGLTAGRAPTREPAAAIVGAPSLPAHVAACLTRADQEQLQREAAAGQALVLLHVAFPAADFDTRLRSLADALRGHGTLIATVPEPAPGGGGGEAALGFGLVVALPRGTALPEHALSGIEHQVEVLEGPRGAAPVAQPDPEDDARELLGVSESLRVPLQRLDRLTEQVADLRLQVTTVRHVVAGLRQDARPDRRARELERAARGLETRLAALQRGAIQARLAPLEQVLNRLARLVTRTARVAGREVEFAAHGGETEIDKSVMDRLATPLVHLMRNAIDHGIEPPEERVRTGKPRVGRVEVRARTLGGQVVLEIEDDGRGISPAVVAREAARRGLLPEGRSLSESEAHEMLFAAGFSTVDRVNEVSGRGVGLDVVRRAIGGMRGSLTLRSLAGAGTTITMTLPISLALLPALIVRAGGRRFAIPLVDVRENIRVDPDRLRREGDEAIYEHPRGRLPLRRLDPFVTSPGPSPEGYAVVVGPPERAVGFLVEACLGQREIIIRRVGRSLDGVAGLAGATEIGEDGALLVLNLPALVEGPSLGVAAG